jgi:hypothetical protein
MTARDFLDLLGAHPMALGLGLAAAPLLALLLSFALPKERHLATPWRHVDSLLLHAACLPGVLAALLCAYVMLFRRGDLMDLNLLVSLAPVAGMGVTIWALSRAVDFEELPGFDRLWGLFVVTAVTFIILFALSRMRLWLVFGGSFVQFIVVGAGLFLLLTWGSHRAFGPGGGKPEQADSD